MYLLDLLESNITVFITLLILFALPIIIGLYVFTKRTGPEADYEAYEEELKEENKEEGVEA
jgi:hypothetical protein